MNSSSYLEFYHKVMANFMHSPGILLNILESAQDGIPGFAFETGRFFLERDASLPQS